MTIKIGKNCYIADSAVLIGDVEIGDNVAILDGAVLRGDLNTIMIGEGSNIQDNATLHTELNHSTILGKNVSVGHNAIVHGASLSDDIIVGMGAIVMNGASISSGSVVAAGAVVTENFSAEKGSLIAGVPGKVKRSGDPSLLEYARANSASYNTLREKYLIGHFERKRGSDLKK